MAMKIILLSLLGGILSLDRVGPQFMISRPIVAAPLAGLMLGDPYTGLQAGALLELFWIDRLPIGTIVPPNDFLVAFLVASASILAGQSLGHVSRELIALSVLLFIPCGYLAQRVDSLIVKSNDALYDGALQDAKQADIGGIFRKHLSGLAKHFLAYLVLILLSLFCGINLLLYIYPLLPKAVVNALALIFIALPLLGVAAGLNTVNLKGAIPVFSAIFLSISVLWELTHMF
jgi:PTS system mannose-specific IIC component